jgi:hypothetical protein
VTAWISLEIIKHPSFVIFSPFLSILELVATCQYCQCLVLEELPTLRRKPPRSTSMYSGCPKRPLFLSPSAAHTLTWPPVPPPWKWWTSPAVWSPGAATCGDQEGPASSSCRSASTCSLGKFVQHESCTKETMRLGYTVLFPQVRSAPPCVSK